MVDGGEEKHIRKRRKIFGEGKYLFFPKGKEKEESSGESKLENRKRQRFAILRKTQQAKAYMLFKKVKI